jgi:hypothetical protein
MFFSVATLAALAASTSALAIPTKREAISITPHDAYSSSVGVLGCKINTDRVAYWPSAVSCDKMCVRVSANGRSVNLLKIDTSGGAYDIAYDAYNYLLTKDKTLAFTAANAMNFVTSCKETDSWVGKHFSLFNIANSACTLGVDERCEYPDLNLGNQPTCPHQLGLQTLMEGQAVKNIAYGTGIVSKALQ